MAKQVDMSMIDMDLIREQDLATNGGERVPVCLCLDTSGSMLTVTGAEGTGQYMKIDNQTYELAKGGTSRLKTLQMGINLFYDAVYADVMARYSAELAVVTFDDKAEVRSDFSRVEYTIEGQKTRIEVPNLEAHGSTNMGLGINLALDILNKRKEMYQKQGVDYYQPWLVLMTDGEDNGSPAELEKARQRIRELVNDRKLSVYPFFIGEDDSDEAEQGMRTLASLSPKQEPLRIGVRQMKGMFQWLSKSVVAASSGELEPGQTTIDQFVVKSWNDPLI